MKSFFFFFFKMHGAEERCNESLSQETGLKNVAVAKPVSFLNTTETDVSSNTVPVTFRCHDGSLILGLVERFSE